MEEYRLVYRGGIRYLSFDLFEKTGLVIHAFTTRTGGMSTGPYSSLNLAYHVGDDPQAVLDNRKKVCQALGIPCSNLVAGQQVHGSRVHQVTLSDLGKGELDCPIPDADALVTDRPGILLSSYYADCVPLMFLDPVKKAIALAHAGWKGTVRKIAANTIKTMTEKIGANPEDCLVVVGPHIGRCCYRVGPEVIEALEQNGFAPDSHVVGAGEKQWLMDLGGANVSTLLESGVRKENIAVTGLCTACHTDLLFSYRGQAGVCGRMASMIALTHMPYN